MSLSSKLRLLFIPAIGFLNPGVHAGTICFHTCGDLYPTLVESRQQEYQYAGYLNSLSISSSQAIPLSLADIYNTLGLTPNAAVPVTTLLTVTEKKYSNGEVSHDYGYSFSVGNATITGDKFGTDSPFLNNELDALISPSTQDIVRIGDGHYVFHSDDETIQLESRNSYQDNYLVFNQDKFVFSLYNAAAAAIENDLPESNSTLENLFESGAFFLKGSVKVSTADGIVIPFDSTNDIYFQGAFSSAHALFSPGLGSVGVLCRPLCGGIIEIETPLPGGALLFASGIVSLGAHRLRRRIALQN